MSTAYGRAPAPPGHLAGSPTEEVVRDRAVVALAAVAVVAVWVGAAGDRRSTYAVIALAGVTAAAVGARPRRIEPPQSPRRTAARGALVGVVVLAAGVHSATSWSAAVARRLGTFDGWAAVVTDPARVGAATAVVVEIEGERFQVFAYGSPGRRSARLTAGERVRLAGERRPLQGAHQRRARARHVVGEFAVTTVGEVAPGTPAARAANRVRELLRRGAATAMDAELAALFTGLVVGDDTRQSDATIDRFRDAGLSHLTAVSGQNVAYVLAVAAVVLRRLPPWWRLGATWALIGWFAVLTRLEPSVLRASVMAGLAALAFATGTERSPTRLVALAVLGLVLVDPFLVWSVAFWLSTGATFGVTCVAPALEAKLAGPRWLVPALAVTVGAQAGVALPSWLVFGRMPALGLVANLLAVPVAGAVMLVGIPCGIAAAAVPEPFGAVLLAPAAVGTRWVAVVAQLASRLQPHGAVAVAAWAVQATLMWLMWRRGRRRSVAATPTMSG